jgi:ABC-type multidrug transport system permease subunit
MYFREPGALFWTFAFPLLMSVALGVAFRNRPPAPVRVAVVDAPDATATIAALDAADVRVFPADLAHAKEMLRTGKVALAVLAGTPRPYLFDETRPESRLARLVVDDALQRAAGRVDPVATNDRHLTEPGARYIDFFLPGMLGMSVMSSGLWGIGYVIVELRTRKLIKRMVATPMRKIDFLLSFVLLRASVLMFELPVVLGFGRLVFDVQLHGSVILLVSVILLGALAFAGVGLLVASRAQNTQTAAGLVNVVMLPMMVCSGVFFSADNFPDAVQPLIRLLPLTALNDALRAIINEGAGVAAIAPQLGVLGVCMVGSMGAALALFRWQ